MGLIIPTEKQFNINYKARYVELAKPMTGPIAIVIYYVLEDIEGDPNMKINLSNSIATFICWVLGEQLIHRICVYFNLYTQPNAKNPLYRNLKTLSSLGASLGTIIASLCTSLSNRKLSISLYSMVMASIIGLLAFLIRQYDASLLQDEANIDMQVGTEGWSKYGKTALVLGAYIGQFLGGIMAHIQGCDAITTSGNIAFYSAIISVASFVAVMIFVPLINYFTRDKNEKTSRGILVTNDRALFNNNYVRSGLTLGVAMGTILGGILGPVIIPGLSAEVAIALGASTLSIICGIVLGVYGQNLSRYFENAWGVSRNTENSWSYAARSSANFFSYLGIALAYAFCPGVALMHYVAIGSAIGSLIGWFVGLFITWLARKIEPDEATMNATTLPWTQRISIGTTRGTIIGAVAGLAIGFLVGGPFSLVGWSVLLGTIGGIIGGINDIVSDPVFYKSMDKAKSLFKRSASSLFFVTGQSENNLCQREQPPLPLMPTEPNSNQTLNRYSLFACEKIRFHVSQYVNIFDKNHQSPSV